MQSLKPDDLPQNPFECTNIFSRLCFWYTLPTFFRGRKKTLDTKDLYRALKEHKSEFEAKLEEDRLRKERVALEIGALLIAFSHRSLK